MFELAAADVDEALASIEVGEVWGVGPRWATWLEAQGIATALDLKRADPKAIRRKMTVVGERLVYELNGRSCLPLELVDPPRQGLTVSRSFGQTLTALQPIKEALVQFVGRAGEAPAPAVDGGSGPGVRHDQPVFVDPALLRQQRDGDSCPTPPISRPIWSRPPCICSTRLYRPGFHYQKCGVMLLDLSPVTQVQADLFDRGTGPARPG